MNCANCGRQNPAGARYCVHCGIEQSMPTPIAAVAAAAMASRAVPQAANAAQADPPAGERARALAPHLRDVRPRGADAHPAHSGGAAAAGSPGRDNPAPPAYASAPARPGLAALVIAACFVLAIALYAGWRMLGGDPGPGMVTARSGSEGSVMSSFPPEATPQNPRRAATPQEPPASAPTPGGERDRAGAARDATSAATGAGAGKSESSAAAPKADSAPPVEIKPLPARPAAKPARRPAADKPRAEEAQVRAQPSAAPEPAPPAPVVAAAPKAAPVVDRWTRMSDELSRCTREDFIARVICDQRVRLRYCNGYWGKAAQCPANPAPDRGQ